MAQLAIKGHSTRSKKVIEILKMLGGVNKHNYSADCDSLCFYIGKGSNIIYYDWVNNCYEDEDTLVFTLEEFLEKFPYKVGDKVAVTHPDDSTGILIDEISSMKWNGNEILYGIGDLDFSAEEIQPYREPIILKGWSQGEMLEATNDKIDLTIIDKVELVLGDSHEIISECGKYYAVRKKPQYPKTYDECCKILELSLNEHFGFIKDNDCFTDEENKLIESFIRLKRCRDAYWKLAGDWKPDWINTSQLKYSIWFDNNGVCLKSNRYSYAIQHILTFPTSEMRDAFYENFKEQIEQCKELL